MKNKFLEYHYTDEIFDKLVKEAIIILDTNVLLNFYRYSIENREKLFEILYKVKDRLWLPNQVGTEFYKNRIKLLKLKANFKSEIKNFIEDEIQRIINVVKNSNSSCKRRDYISLLKYEDNLQEVIIECMANAKDQMIEKVDQSNNGITWENITSKDPILDKIAELYHGKVNDPIEQNKINDIYKEGKQRYDKKIPPGYEDKKNKPEPECYGDLILWHEIIEYAKVNKKDILFITDDTKEDWYEIVENIKIGPRKELLREFREKTNKLYYSYKTDKFISLISEEYKIEDTEELLDELIKIAEDKEVENRKKWEESVLKFFTYKPNISRRTYEKLLKKYIIDKFKNMNGIDLSLDKMAVMRIEEYIDQNISYLIEDGSMHINLPFISASQNGPLHFSETITKEDIYDDNIYIWGN